jgi:hypothetical protein
MGLLQNIKLYFNHRYLLQLLEKQKPVERKPMNLERARSIGVLFDATNPLVQEQVLEYADQLRRKGKKVSLLGAIDSHQEDGSLPFPSFSLKMLDWALRPQGRAVGHFLQEPFDLLVHLNAQAKNSLDFIAAQANAHLKVGPFLEELSVYDLMIDYKNASIPEFIRDMEALLNKTNTRYAHA